jgi:tetraacyldisaccharide 4'-kinase
MGLFELIYYLGYRIKTGVDVARKKRLPVRVISIGNITTGGTGKTPATIALAGEASRRGFMPCVLTRGYRGKLRGPVLVSPGMSEGDVGDEALLMARKLSRVPVVKGVRRYEAGLYALSSLSPAPDLFILDDGFQHRRIHRDMDVVLVSAVNPFDNRRLLPMGLLREPPRQLERADAIVITKSDGLDTSELEAFIRRYNSAAPVFRSGVRPTGIRSVQGEEHDPEWLRGRSVFLFSGIAEPDTFPALAGEAGARIAGTRFFRDHYRYRQRDLEEIGTEAGRAGADWIMTTEKDIMRLGGLGVPENLMSLGMEFAGERGLYDFVLNPENPAEE